MGPWGVKAMRGEGPAPCTTLLGLFLLLETLGLVSRDWVFYMEVFSFDLKTQYWLEF